MTNVAPTVALGQKPLSTFFHIASIFVIVTFSPRLFLGVLVVQFGKAYGLDATVVYILLALFSKLYSSVVAAKI